MFASLKGDMDVNHLGGIECPLDNHDPNKDGDCGLLSRRSHLHWDSTLQPLDEVVLTTVESSLSGALSLNHLNSVVCECRYDCLH